MSGSGGDGAAFSAPLMVGVSGMRGIVGESLTPEVAARYAGVLGGWFCERGFGDRARVVVGWDGRSGGAVVRDAALAGLAGAGCDVVSLGVAATPTVGVMVDALGADGGVVVTASHNPQEWNGLKALTVVREGAPGTAGGGAFACAPEAGLAVQIVERFHAGRVGRATWDRVGDVEAHGGSARVHVERVVSAMGAAAEGVRRRGFKVVVDSVNASGAEGARVLLSELGCEVVHLGADGSGLFPHAPEPVRENLGDLCEAVRAHGADVGFAQDPDADRLAVVDERGEYIGEEYTLALAAEAVLGGAVESGGVGTRGVAANLSTSRMIEDVAGRHSASAWRSAVGEANVVALMRERGCVLGGEGNGGVIWPAVTYVRDSLSAMGLVLALLSGRGEELSGVVGSMPSYWIEKRKVALGRREEAEAVQEKVAAVLGGGGRVSREDGVRVDLDDRGAWVHVRASNTEPVLRLIAEAPTREGAAGLLDEVEGVIGGGG